MRRLVVMLAALAALAVALPGSAGARHTLTHRVAQLETKVNGLQRKVNTMQTKLDALHTFTHRCVTWRVAPLASYGDFEEPYTFGYRWVQPTGEEILVSALDFAPPDQADMFVPAIDPGCVSQAASRLARVQAGVDELAKRLSD